MANRFRIEIYDANKQNDLTIYSEQGIDKEYLTELVFSNLRRFNGTVRAYVFDSLKKKKTTAMFLDEEIVDSTNAKTNVTTAKQLNLIQRGSSWTTCKTVPLFEMPPQLRGYPQPYGYLWKTPENL